MTKRCDELVEALREAAGDYTAWNKTLGYQAADEIERLQAALLWIVRREKLNNPTYAAEAMADCARTALGLPDEPSSGPTA